MSCVDNADSRNRLSGEIVSTELYKDQAERLGQHLATKHGIKLKKASILESVAALHGHRDWNTLVAQPSSPSEQAPLTSASSATELNHEVRKLVCDLAAQGYSDLVFMPPTLGEGSLSARKNGVSHRHPTEQPVENLTAALLEIAGIQPTPEIEHHRVVELESDGRRVKAYIVAYWGPRVLVRMLENYRRPPAPPRDHLTQLGLDSKSIAAWLETLNGADSGLFFSVGPTGSGKSTLLDVTSRELQRDTGAKVAAIAQVAEFPPVSNGLQLSDSVLSDIPALIELLREKQVTLVSISETRRYLPQALALAEAGFRVLADLHAASPSRVPHVLRAQGIPGDQVKLHVRAAMAPHLVKNGSGGRTAVAELQVFGKDGNQQEYGIFANVRDALRSGDLDVRLLRAMTDDACAANIARALPPETDLPSAA
jgi:hypothetical protein